MLQSSRGRTVDEAAAACASLSALLWLHRANLETLLFKLVEERLVVASGSTRWLNRADAEVVVALDRMHDGEVIRSMEVQQLAVVLGLPAEATLAELATAAPEPWSTMFDDHRTALRTLAAEIRGIAAENRSLLEAGAAAVRDTLDRVGSDLRTYDASGRAVGGSGGPLLLDQQA